MAFFLYMVAFMDTVGDDPDWRHGRAVEVERVRRLGPVLRRPLLPDLRRVDVGRRLARQARATALDLGFGYVDFAGSGVVHAVGGVAALAGAIVLGPRIGKYGKDGKPRALGPHHIPMAMLGTFILLFGWFGFNAASTLAVDRRPVRGGRHEHRDRRQRSAPSSAMFWVMRSHRQARSRDDGQRHARRTRGDHGSVCVRAAVGGSSHRHHRRSHRRRGGVVLRAQGQIDDPVGAISVHGVCGAFGVLAVGIFADGQYGQAGTARSMPTPHTGVHRHPLRRRRLGPARSPSHRRGHHLHRDVRGSRSSSSRSRTRS